MLFFAVHFRPASGGQSATRFKASYSRVLLPFATLCVVSQTPPGPPVAPFTPARLDTTGPLPRLEFAVPGWGWGDGGGGARGAAAVSGPLPALGDAACPTGACVAVTIDPKTGGFRFESPVSDVRLLNRTLSERKNSVVGALIAFFRKYAPQRIREVARVCGLHPVEPGMIGDELEPRPANPLLMEVAFRALSPSSPLYLVVPMSLTNYSPEWSCMCFQVARGPGGEPPVVRPWAPPPGCARWVRGGAAWAGVLAAAAEWAAREGAQWVLSVEAGRRLRVPTGVVLAPGQPVSSAVVRAVHGGALASTAGRGAAEPQAPPGAAALGVLDLSVRGGGGTQLELARSGATAAAADGDAAAAAKLATGAAVEATGDGGVRVVVPEVLAPRSLGGLGVSAETVKAVRATCSAWLRAFLRLIRFALPDSL